MPSRIINEIIESVMSSSLILIKNIKFTFNCSLSDNDAQVGAKSELCIE
jgi:hypothetical protein